MTLEEFIDKLFEAGWRSPNDAQWTKIAVLWEELKEKGIVTKL